MSRSYRESWISKAIGIGLVFGLAYILRNVDRFENAPRPVPAPQVVPTEDLIAAAERLLAEDIGTAESSDETDVFAPPSNVTD